MKRLENESFEDYRKRRDADNKRTKELLKGTYVWYSRILDPKDSTKYIGKTYIKANELSVA